tara:strand:+ start:128 stop:451 length:324 start_codon:yes stop_codon:yes gene_type:complete
MREYFFLFMAIAFEVLGTILLPLSQGFTRLVPSTIIIISYIISLYLLTIALENLPLPVVYSSWAGLGVFSIAVMSYLFYGEALNWQSILGLFLIVIGVAIVNYCRVA